DGSHEPAAHARDRDALSRARRAVLLPLRLAGAGDRPARGRGGRVRFAAGAGSAGREVPGAERDVSAFLEALCARAAAVRKRIVFPEGTDERTLEAVARLQREELVFPIVLGPPDKIRQALAGLGADADAIEVADPFRDPRRDELAGLLHQLCAERGMTRAEADERVTDPLYFGALLVRRGDADGGVAGAV